MTRQERGPLAAGKELECSPQMPAAQISSAYPPHGKLRVLPMTTASWAHFWGLLVTELLCCLNSLQFLLALSSVDVFKRAWRQDNAVTLSKQVILHIKILIKFSTTTTSQEDTELLTSLKADPNHWIIMPFKTPMPATFRPTTISLLETSHALTRESLDFSQHPENLEDPKICIAS